MGWTTEELSFDYQEGQEIFLSSTASRHILSPIEYRVLFPDTKRPGRGDNTSAPSAKVNNEQSCAFISCTTTACLLPCRVARLNQSP